MRLYLILQTFPDNTVGTRLDVVCRASLWQSGRDFAHGTGHGVGANLCVHEGPVGMSGRRSRILSDMGLTEPGIRKDMVSGSAFLSSVSHILALLFSLDYITLLLLAIYKVDAYFYILY